MMWLSVVLRVCARCQRVVNLIVVVTARPVKLKPRFLIGGVVVCEGRVPGALRVAIYNIS
jgi:hypothetical protein